jgi:hypothetical protein
VRGVLLFVFGAHRGLGHDSPLCPCHAIAGRRYQLSRTIEPYFGKIKAIGGIEPISLAAIHLYAGKN